MKVLRGAWRFLAGDAPEMVPVVATVIGLAFALRHEGAAVAVLPAVVGVALAFSVITRARRHGRSAGTGSAGIGSAGIGSAGTGSAGIGSVEGDLPVGAAQAEGLDQ